MVLPIGKLDSKILKTEVIDKIKFHRDDVKTRAGIGRDCSCVDFGGLDLVVSSDPVTADVADIGRLAVSVTTNDIASEGVEPAYIMMTCLLPEGTTLDQLRDMMAQAAEAAAEAGIEIIGGHTEVTRAVTTPVISSTAFGKRKPEQAMKPETIEEGDVFILTKTAGLEGTGIIASDYEDRAKAFLEPGELEHAKAMLDQVSVIEEGVLGGKLGVKEMHDVTEGGVLGAVWELCDETGLGAEIVEDDIPVDAVTLKLMKGVGVDWRRLISSGCMLVAADPDTGDDFIDEAGELGIPAAVIGTFTAKGSPVTLLKPSGKTEVIEPPEADELYKVVGR
ncbi:MAG: AIR synthase-related protein [Eubacteriales bacterium]|nr:AIR synthase-related protein [Eubacteriales bacterium]